MIAASNRGVLRLTVEVMRAVAILAAVGLLAGCTGNGGTDSNASLAVNADGDTGNGIGGNGGDANGGNAGNGGNGASGADGTPGAEGASGGGSSGSGSVTGSGRLISRAVAVAGVTSVVVETSFVVRLTLGETEQATIRTDDNLIDLINATVTDGVLRLGLKPGNNVRNATLSAEVTVRDLDRLTASGASQVTLVSPPMGPALHLDTSGASQITGPIQVDHLDASASGASTLTLSGQAESLRLNTTGASRLPSPDLTVADLDATLSGASHATVAVSDTLAATASGASALRYRGTPTITRQQTSGISSIAQNSP